MGFWRKTSAHVRKKLAASSKVNSPCPRAKPWGIFLQSDMILIYFHFWWMTSGMCVKIDLYVCWQCFEEKHSFRRNYLFFISLHCKKLCFVVGLLITSGQWAKNLRCFGKKVSAASSKMHFTFGRQKLEEKFVSFEKKDKILFFFGFSARKILVMDEKFMVVLLYLFSTCLANNSMILDNLSIFLQLSGFEQKKSDFQEEISRRIVGTTLYKSRN